MNTRAQRDTGPGKRTWRDLALPPGLIRDGMQARGGSVWSCVACGAYVNAECPCCEPPRCTCKRLVTPAPLVTPADTRPPSLSATLRTAERIHATLAASRPRAHQPLAFCSCGVACAYRRAKSDPRQ